MTLTHAFVSAKSDPADTSLIRPSNWNDPHDDANIIDAAGEHGVVADGTTDDTTAMQAALDAWVASTTKAILRLPGGVIKTTAALTVGLCNNKTIQGAGRDVTKIRQFTADTPVLKFTAEDTWGIRLRGLTLEYNTQQTSAQTNSIALNFDKTGGTGSGWYYWSLDDVAFRKAAYGWKVTGTGQLPIFNFSSRDLWFQDMAVTAINIVSPAAIGSMPNIFINTIINNGGIVPTLQAIAATSTSMTFLGLTITYWHNGVIYANAGSQVRIDQLQLEHGEIDDEFSRLIAIDDPGFMQVSNASITVDDVVGSTNWVFRADYGARLRYDGIYVDSVDPIRLLGVANGSDVQGGRFWDARGTVVVPGDVDGSVDLGGGYAIYTRYLSGLVSFYRFDERQGTAAVDAKAVQNGVYQNTPNLGVKGLTHADPSTGVELNGSSQYVSIADHATHHVGNVFSLALTVRLDTAVAQQLIYGNATNSYGIDVTSGNVLRIIQDSVGIIASSTITLALGVPQHIVWTRSGNGADKIYINGEDRTGSVTSVGPIANSNGPRIGSTGFSAYVDGAIKDAAIFNRALTLTEVGTMAALMRGY